MGIVQTFKGRSKKKADVLDSLPRRPMPPAGLLELRDTFAPAEGLGNWIMETFVLDTAPLFNPMHRHLRQAQIGYLWTTTKNSRSGNDVVGAAELGTPPSSMGRWGKARYAQQMREWFGPKPLDFVVTLYAPYAAEVDDLSWCALSEHEISHCGQKRHRRTRALMFNRETGKPVFGLRGHDVEEFVHIVDRYGPGAAAGRTLDLIEAARTAPLIGAADIAGACGTCMRRAA